MEIVPFGPAHGNLFEESGMYVQFVGWRIHLMLALLAWVGSLSGPAFAQTVVEPARDVPIGGTEYVDNFDAADSNQGRYSTSIPIEALPGRNGIAPNLSFEYNSGGPNGPLGIGWSIGGTSVIERRGPQGGVALMTAADRFYVDGVELVNVGGNNYRTVRNDYVKYTSTSVAGFVRCWSAKADGYETVYGDCNSDADRSVEYRDENSTFSGTHPVRFHLHFKRDVKLNEIRYIYTVNSVTTNISET
jgi:hypothetical protein